LSNQLEPVQMKNYLKMALLLATAWLVNAFSQGLLAHLGQMGGTESAIAETLWCLSLFLVFGWACSKTAEGTVFPSFTLQLLVGIVLHDALAPLASALTLSVVVCTALAAIILKSGGDEIESKEFWSIAYPTVMLAVLGYLLTFTVMFALLMALGLDGKTAALLSAILGSTDPAALIPTLRQLVFKSSYQRVSNIAVAESALNDAVGAIFTAAIAAMVLSGASLDSLGSLTKGLLSADNLLLLCQQFVFGTLAGVLGWCGMWIFERYKAQRHALEQAEHTYDFALVLVVPLVTFVLAQAMHGNGFLAAFVVGLLGNFNQGSPEFKTLLHTMESKIESVAKPIIFMMVGPFVSLSDLSQTVWLGLAISAVFILVARPVSVLLSLLPTQIGFKEKLFLCAVRETGVIPVVLAVITVAQFPEMVQLMSLTAWVVIWTLTLLPAVTPWWARQLRMTE
jgi:NhaP-type Na+/H+ or K+/H+ antiporter